MSSIDENIRNAMKVVRKTHENVQKLMTCCKNLSKQNDSGYRELLADKDYLRHLSRDEYLSWAIGSFILLFAKADVGDDTIYGVEIDLDAAKVKAIKYVYDGAIDIEKTVSPGDHWKYAHPLRDDRKFEFCAAGAFIKSVPKSADINKKYLSLQFALFAEFPLSEIKFSNVKEKIFGTFDKLAASSEQNQADGDQRQDCRLREV